MWIQNNFAPIVSGSSKPANAQNLSLAAEGMSYGHCVEKVKHFALT